MVKNLPTNAGDIQYRWVQSLGRVDLLENERATYPSILGWEIPWTEETGGLQFMGSQSQTRVSDYTAAAAVGVVGI